MICFTLEENPNTRVFDLLSSRTNLHLSSNPACRNHWRLQNHHGYIKHHHRGMGGSPGDVGEVSMTQVKQRNGCRTSCDVGKAAEGLENELCLILQPFVASPTSQLILQPFRRFTYSTSQLVLQPFRCFNYVIDTSPTSQLILQPFRRFIYVTAHSTTLPLLHLRHRHFTQPTSPGEPPMHRGMKKQAVVDQLVTESY